MSTKLNPEALASKAAGGSDRFVAWRKGYAAAIREHSQPIADERDELRDIVEATEGLAGLAPWVSDPEMKRLLLDTANRARAILSKYPKTEQR
jgi:hypothetical protein